MFATTSHSRRLIPSHSLSLTPSSYLTCDFLLGQAHLLCAAHESPLHADATLWHARQATLGVERRLQPKPPQTQQVQQMLVNHGIGRGNDNDNDEKERISPFVRTEPALASLRSFATCVDALCDVGCLTRVDSVRHWHLLWSTLAQADN